MAAPKSDQPMFTGEHPRTLDVGLRVILPKDWRSLKITEFFLISGSAEPYIKAMPRSEYDKAVAEITSDPSLSRAQRNIHLRSLGSKCTRVILDSSGRMTLPAELCKEIGVSAEKPDVTLQGAVLSFEIWNSKGLEHWERRQARPDDSGLPRMNVKEFLGV
jgi:DNA-binding transcriptional regulator/RsmH inhibitor MraZ